MTIIIYANLDNSHGDPYYTITIYDKKSGNSESSSGAVDAVTDEVGCQIKEFLIF